MQHIIKKQILDLTLNKDMDAFAVQHLASERYWQEIVPVLQKSLDSMSTENEVVYLDKLEIDIGMISIKDIEKGRWNDEMYKKVSEQLSLLTAGSSFEKKVKKQSKALSIAEQWIFYMKHGYLPWNVLRIDEEWYKKVLEAFASDSTAISKLRFLIGNNSAAATRIIFQHSSKFLEALLETLTAKKQDKFARLIEELSQMIIVFNQRNTNNQFQKKQLVQQLWLQAFQFSTSGKDDFNSSNFIRHLLKTNVSNQEINVNSTGIDEEGVFVKHAGVVLLLPFLNMFFKNLDLVKENAFVSESAQQKALFLLHYMATGLTTPNEHELVIGKILCAWPLEKPVNNSIQFSDNERKEADDLLTEVIQQWKILKKTSFAGLRQGFLQRNGKLYTRNDNLHLQIEASAIDVLLDQLPWNLSLVKLPWMNDILRVEWR